MRLSQVILPAAALLGVAGLLLWQASDDSPVRPDRGSGADGPGRDARGGAEPAHAIDLPDVLATARSARQLGVADDALRAFVSACLAAGPRAIPELVARLNAGDDKQLRARWRFREGRPQPYASVRAAYLDALASIPGREAERALAALIEHLASVDEIYQVSFALADRRVPGWSKTALAAAAAPATAATMETQKSLLALAARHAPGDTAQSLVALAPRGTDKTDPVVLTSGLHALQRETAGLVTHEILRDAATTRRAKARYLREYFNRPGGEADNYRDAARWLDDGTKWTPSLRTVAAYAAINSVSFEYDRIALDRARAQRDTTAANAIRTRVTARLEAVRAFVEAAIQEPLERTNSERSASLKRAIKRLENKYR